MDRTLISTFRNKVNEEYIVLHMYRENQGKNKWSIICSAMDWIEVVIESIDLKNVSKGNDNMSSITVMTFITCIDVLWEGIQQLHRVFFNTTKIPFSEENTVFRHKLFDTTDNKYFKTIRACYASHPVNLDDCFGENGESEQRYASWSGGGFGHGDFSVILYSNQMSKDDIFMDIYFEELLAFAKQRYEYLYNIMEEIKNQTEAYFKKWRSKEIKRVTAPLDQIEILIEESKARLDDDYYNHELEKLRILFATSITNHANNKAVSKYRFCLQSEINEIYKNLQEMNFVELNTAKLLKADCPYKYHYNYSKLCDVVYGSGHPEIIDVHKFDQLLTGIIDLSGFSSYTELYVLINTGLFLYNGILSNA